MNESDQYWTDEYRAELIALLPQLNKAELLEAVRAALSQPQQVDVAPSLAGSITGIISAHADMLEIFGRKRA